MNFFYVIYPMFKFDTLIFFRYVKAYLLPDRTKSGKRKTKVKKHTLNPSFDESLKVCLLKVKNGLNFFYQCIIQQGNNLIQLYNETYVSNL